MPEEHKKEFVLFHMPLNAIRLAMAAGATITVLFAVVMQVFGWFTGDAYWNYKGLVGFANAGLYFVVVLLLKCLETELTKERKKVSIVDLLNEEVHVNRERVQTQRKNPQPKKRKGGK